MSPRLVHARVRRCSLASAFAISMSDTPASRAFWILTESCAALGLDIPRMASYAAVRVCFSAASFACFRAMVAASFAFLDSSAANSCAGVRSSRVEWGGGTLE